MKGSRWGLGKGLQTPRTSHVLPCHVTKEKKKKLKIFFAYQNAFLNSMESFFFSLSVTRKLYPKSADQTLRRFESGNKAQGCTMCLNVTKKKILITASVLSSPSAPGPPSCALWPFPALELISKAPLITSQNIWTRKKEQ